MRERYLEVTFRKGKPLAAYLYLPRTEGAKSARTEAVAPGILIDYSSHDIPIGIEFTDPVRVSAEDVSSILLRLGLAPIEARELAPLHAA